MPVIHIRYEEDYAVLQIRTKTGKEFETLVDIEDVKLVENYNWFLNAYGYVNASHDGTAVYLHRLIKKAKRGDVVDHEFGNPLDNRKSKLRVTNRKRNGQHRVKLSKKNKSGRTGIHQSPSGKWVAQIRIDRKVIHIGTFDSFEEALNARSLMEIKHCGEFAPKA